MSKKLFLTLVICLTNILCWAQYDFLPDIRVIESKTKKRMISFSSFWLKSEMGDSIKLFKKDIVEVRFRCWEGACDEYLSLYNTAKENGIDSIQLKRIKILLSTRWYELEVKLSAKANKDLSKTFRFYFDYYGVIHSIWKINSKDQEELVKMY